MGRPTWEEWLKDMMEKEQADPGAARSNRTKIETLTWEIWKERCWAYHNNELPRPQVTLEKGLKLARESEVQDRSSQYTTQVRQGPRRAAVWRPPEQGTIKINCDGA